MDIVPVLTAKQMKEWDQFTIKTEPISSYNLMERAANSCMPLILEKIQPNHKIAIVCGQGNNGGDGLVIARKLLELKYRVEVFLLQWSNLSKDTESNTNLIPDEYINTIDPENTNISLEKFDVIIDALFGTGLDRPVKNPLNKWIEKINSNRGTKISIDLPSGLFTDQLNIDDSIVKANYTISFQAVKRVFIFPESSTYTGILSITDIGLRQNFPLLKEVNEFAVKGTGNLKMKIHTNDHKYKRGVLKIIAGSPGMFGAAVLCTKGAQSVGTGLIKVFSEKKGPFPVPEVLTFSEKGFSKDVDKNITAIVCGPGIGVNETKWTKDLEGYNKCPVLFDADAITQIATYKKYHFPKTTVMTPHEGELKRLIGNWENMDDMITKAKNYASKNKLHIIVKGPKTKIISPEGKLYVNFSGNPLLATAGSGDVLSGMIGGLLSRGYGSLESCVLGTYLHGRAADLFAKNHPNRFFTASQLTDYVTFDLSTTF